MRLLGIVLSLTVSLTHPASSQPTELFKCITWGVPAWPDCGIPQHEIFDDCGGVFSETLNVAWYPLRYIAPITIELKTRGAFAFNLPLYVEVVPLPDSTAAGFCKFGYYPSIPGHVVGVASGVQVCGGGWETFGPVDLREILSIGGSYALKLRGFWRFPALSSPSVDCVRVTPVTSQTPNAEVSWGRVKNLYR